MKSWKQCALPFITTMALLQLMHLSTFIYVYMYIYEHVNIYIYIYIPIYSYIYIYIYIYIHIYSSTHINTYTCYILLHIYTLVTLSVDIEQYFTSLTCSISRFWMIYIATMLIKLFSLAGLGWETSFHNGEWMCSPNVPLFPVVSCVHQ